MTVTIRVPKLRSLALILIGAALGATLIAPVSARVTGSAIEPAAIQTRSSSCHGYDFMPVTSGVTYGVLATYRWSPSGGVFVCDPGLPTRAVVTKVQFTVRDDTASGQVSNCALGRNGMTPATVLPAQILASVPATGVGEAPGVVRLTDTSVDFATVSHGRFAYWLQCELSGGVGLYGATVTYTIDSANG